MKMRSTPIICALLLLVGCASPLSYEGRTDTISRETAIRIAQEGCRANYDPNGTIAAEFDGTTYCITLPIDKTAPPGTRYRGPDYAAKIWIDAKTGKVLKVLLAE